MRCDESDAVRVVTVRERGFKFCGGSEARRYARDDFKFNPCGFERREFFTGTTEQRYVAAFEAHDRMTGRCFTYE